MAVNLAHANMLAPLHLCLPCVTSPVAFVFERFGLVGKLCARPCACTHECDCAYKVSKNLRAKGIFVRNLHERLIKFTIIHGLFAVIHVYDLNVNVREWDVNVRKFSFVSCRLVSDVEPFDVINNTHSMSLCR